MDAIASVTTAGGEKKESYSYQYQYQQILQVAVSAMIRPISQPPTQILMRTW